MRFLPLRKNALHTDEDGNEREDENIDESIGHALQQGALWFGGHFEFWCFRRADV